jgi:hypothetical protein
MTGLDFETFRDILQESKVYYNKFSPFSKDGLIFKLFGGETACAGCPRLMSAADGLGLVLTWTRTRGSTMVLQLIFGMTQSSISDYLTFCTHILIHVLQGRDDAKIKRPTPEKIVEYQQAVYHHHPFLGDVWCTMDGVKLMVECSGDDDKQNRFYNRWTCDHYIGAVLVFCPDGTIPICWYNVAGTVHDSLIATIGKIYDKLKVIYERTGA